MANRRDFLKTSLALTAGVASASVACASAEKHAFAKGIIYTKENPGKWAKKAGGHLPVVTVEGTTVTVETKHSMSMKHYIVRHTLVSSRGEVLGAKTFAPTDENALSVFELEQKEASQLYATSFCNQHDMWVTPFQM